MAVEAGLVSLVLSDPIAAELREKLIDKFHVPHEEADAVLDHLKAHAEVVSAPGRSGWVTQDPDDDKFIDAALTAGAAIIVSGDRHLLDLGTVAGIEILTSRKFLERLPGVSDDGDTTTDRWKRSSTNAAMRLLEPVRPGGVRRALVTILDEGPTERAAEVTLLSEAALAEDWERPEEGEAWKHLQKVQ